jgi:hypothetical protein
LVIPVVVLICRTLLLGCEVLRAKGFWGRRKPSSLGMGLLLAKVLAMLIVVILA